MEKLKIIIGIFVIVVVGVLAIWYSRPHEVKANVLDSFAQCLTDKGVIMYGAAWCAHCQNQKAAFGSAFKYATYVECPDDPQKCIDKGIQGYPTWITKDGTKLVGEQSFTALSQASGCPLPSGVK
jgi:hypothetical protein